MLDHTEHVLWMTFCSSNTCREWSGFHVLPDLNPIEYLWNQLRRFIQRLGKLNQRMEDLRRALQETWDDIPQIRIQRLIGSMMIRCAASIAAGGGPTRY